MRFTTNLLLTVLSTSLTLASPLLSTPRQCSSTTLKLDYYQGYSSPSACGTAVSTDGNITTGTCNNFLTQAVKLYPDASENCTFTLYRGVTDCSGGAQAGEVTELKASADAVCVGTGVETPQWYHASGVLSCGC